MSHHVPFATVRLLLTGLATLAILILPIHTVVYAQAPVGKLLKSNYSDNTVGGLHADGTIWIWGNNDNGQLGDNSTTSRSSAVYVVKGNQYNGTAALGDNTANPIIDGSTGQGFSIAAVQDGVVYTWGKNASGELGIGSTSPSMSSIPVKVLKGQYSGTTYLGDNTANKITSVFSAAHSMALASNGLVYAWGDNSDGQIGDNTTTNRTSPVKVRKGEYTGTTYLGDNTSDPVIAIVASRANGIALTSSGNVYMWGSNDHGQLSNGTTTDVYTPVKIRKGQYPGSMYLGDAAGNKVVQIGGNWSSGYALTEKGEIYGWGYNTYGQLGNNSTVDVYTPVRMLKGQYAGTTYLGDASTNRITTLRGMMKQLAGIAEDGTVYIVGRNNKGQLGDGTTTNRATPIRVLKGSCYNGTTYLGDNSTFKVVDAMSSGTTIGTGSTIYLTEGDGKVYSTGMSTDGQLGDSLASSDRTTVCLVKANSIALQGTLMRSTSSNGGLGIVSPDGTIFMWGVNSCNQLGDNSGIDQPKPVKVVEGQYSGTQYLGDQWSDPVSSGSIGVSHTVALMGSSGLVYSWGCGSRGELGKGSTSNSATPVKVNKGQYSGTTYLGDQITNKITMVDAAQHTLALATNGTIYSWGYNGNGQIGNNSTTNATSPVRTQKGQYSGTTYLGDGASDPITMVNAGYSNSLALSTAGLVYSWGNNAYGQIGDNTTTNRLTPIKVLKGQYSGTTYLGDNASNKVKQIVSGNQVSAALMADGTVYTWGRNNYGQLGNSSTSNSYTPVRVRKGQYTGTTYLGDNTANKITNIFILHRSVAAIAADGTVYTWGYNNAGQLGDGTTTNRTTPIRVVKGAYSGTTYLGDSNSDPVTNISGTGVGDGSSGNELIFITNSGKVYQTGNSTSTPMLLGPFSTDLALPVELSVFSASLSNNLVDLRWTTSSEVNSYSIEVERRIGDDLSWKSVGYPIPGHGTTRTAHDYNASDDVSDLRVLGEATLYYRLKFIDLDGSVSLSPVVEVKMTPHVEKTTFAITPNPAPSGSPIAVSYQLPERSNVTLSMYNQLGQLVHTLVSGDQDAGSHEYRFIPGHLNSTLGTLPAGTYFWRLEVNGSVTTRQVIIAK